MGSDRCGEGPERSVGRFVSPEVVIHSGERAMTDRSEAKDYHVYKRKLEKEAQRPRKGKPDKSAAEQAPSREVRRESNDTSWIAQRARNRKT